VVDHRFVLQDTPVSKQGEFTGLLLKTTLPRGTSPYSSAGIARVAHELIPVAEAWSLLWMRNSPYIDARSTGLLSTNGLP
jgi:hypothetical protein